MTTANRHQSGRSGQRPEEVNPWKEHVIENDPTHKAPRDIPAGDVPKEQEDPLHDSEFIDRTASMKRVMSHGHF